MARHINKILFIGLGGAGQRHIRLFRKRFPMAKFFAFRRIKKTPLLKPDFSVKENSSIEDYYGIKIFNDIKDAYAVSPDLVVISVPTAFHSKEIISAANRGLNVFVEKPGASNVIEINEIKNAFIKGKGDFFVSFQRRFQPVVQEMFKLVSSKKIGPIISVKIQVDSYVPDWHPYENFLDLYACRKELGGGVLRTECHELDLLLEMFGMPKKANSIVSRRGPFNLNVADSADILLEYDNFAAQISICFMQKIQERTITICGQNGKLMCDLLNQNIEVKWNDINDPIDVVQLTNEEIFERQLDFYLNSFEIGSNDYIKSVKNLMQLIEMIELGADSNR